MKIYKRGDNGEIIMHSDTYLGEEYVSPNMTHYKYIKKENELYHYGVLGMKWGIRRAYEQGKKYEYKSHGQKKYEKKYNSLNQKIKDNKDSYDKKQLLRKRNKLDKIKNKLETYKARDKNRVDYAKTANLGKSILKTVLFGVIGTGNYNRLRSAGQNRIVSALGGSLLGTFIAPVGIGLSKAVENTAGRSRAQGEGKYKKKSNKFDRVLN